MKSFIFQRKQIPIRNHFYCNFTDSDMVQLIIRAAKQMPQLLNKLNSGFFQAIYRRSSSSKNNSEHSSRMCLIRLCKIGDFIFFFLHLHLGAQGVYQTGPSDSIWGYCFQFHPCFTEIFRFGQHRSFPGYCWSSHFPLHLRIPLHFPVTLLTH